MLDEDDDIDDDGYPTEWAIQKVQEWSVKDLVGFFNYVRSLWRWADCGYWSETEPGHYEISTGGWSGNEDLIAAMRQNYLVWSLCWVESRRGGHFKFELPVEIGDET